MSAFEYETEGKYESFYKRMLIENDEDKLNLLKVKSPNNILADNTIMYDFECASKGNQGHKPYFNHMIHLYNGVEYEEKTLIHYINSDDVCKDTFEYIMKIVEFQCDMYKKGQDKKIIH